MDFKYITDITHLFPADPDAEMPDEALAFREYLGHVIKTDDERNPHVEVMISRDEMRALLSGGLYDPESDRIIYSARPSMKGILLHGLYGDMDNFEGYLAADANHEENRKRQRVMDELHEKVHRALQTIYGDHDLGAD